VAPRTFKIPLAPQESNSVSHPVSLRNLAVSPPEAAWDPEYLIERDPRYVVGDDGAESEEDSCKEEEESYGYRDSYADRRGSGSEWDSGEETDYLSDEYTDIADREDTEDFSESEAGTFKSFTTKRKYSDTDNFTEMEDEINEAFHCNKVIEETDSTNYDEAITLEEAETNEIYENVNHVPDLDPGHYQTPGIPRPVTRRKHIQTSSLGSE